MINPMKKSCHPFISLLYVILLIVGLYAPASSTSIDQDYQDTHPHFMLCGVTQRNLAFVLVGVPTWALVDVTWSMLSQLADNVPEGYNISAYLILSLTIGNAVPLLCNSRLKACSISGVRRVIACILTTGCICGVAMALLWRTTIPVGGNDYSLVFCLIFFAVGACSSTSNVTHFTYVAVFPDNETTALSTGMALGSMAAGVMGLLQGAVLEDAGMSVASCYLAVSALYIPALWLVWSAAPLIVPPVATAAATAMECGPEEGEQQQQQDEMSEEEGGWSQALLSGGSAEKHCESNYVSTRDLRGRRNSLLKLHMLNCALGYGVVPSLVAPVCSRFASPSAVLLLATGLFCVLDPACRAVTAVRPLRTLCGIAASSGALLLLALLLLITLLLPARSGLLTAPGGGAYAVVLYVGFGVTFGFTNLSVFLYIKTHTPAALVQDAYRWTGIVSQAGALCGSLVSFLLVVSGALD